MDSVAALFASQVGISSEGLHCCCCCCWSGCTWPEGLLLTLSLGEAGEQVLLGYKAGQAVNGLRCLGMCEWAWDAKSQLAGVTLSFNCSAALRGLSNAVACLPPATWVQKGCGDLTLELCELQGGSSLSSREGTDG